MSIEEPGSGEGVRTDAPSRPRAAGPEPTGTPGAVALAILLYVGVRLLVVAVIAGVLVVVGLPLLIALLAAIVVALPLSLFFFRGLRARLAGEIDAATASRRERRERLRAELRGEVDPEDGGTA